MACIIYHKSLLHCLPPSTLPPPLVPLLSVLGNLFTPEKGGCTGKYVPPFKVYPELLQEMKCGYGCNWKGGCKWACECGWKCGSDRGWSGIYVTIGICWHNECVDWDCELQYQWAICEALGVAAQFYTKSGHQCATLRQLGQPSLTNNLRELDIMSCNQLIVYVLLSLAEI